MSRSAVNQSHWNKDYLHNVQKSFKDIRTGDLLFFESWSINSLSVKAATWSRWTHVGLAVWLETDTGPNLYCFESSNNLEWDILTNSVKSGCRLVSVIDLIYKDSAIAYRGIDIVRNADFYAKFISFMRSWSNTPFYANFGDMFVSSLGYNVDKDPPKVPYITDTTKKNGKKRFSLLAKRTHNPTTITDMTHVDGVFCSQLVSIYLEHFDLITPYQLLYYPHTRVSPKTFAEDRNYSSIAIGLFTCDLTVVYDAKVGDAVKVCLIVIQLAAFFMYILLTADAEHGFKRSGGRDPRYRKYCKKKGKYRK